MRLFHSSACTSRAYRARWLAHLRNICSCLLAPAHECGYWTWRDSAVGALKQGQELRSNAVAVEMPNRPRNDAGLQDGPVGNPRIVAEGEARLILPPSAARICKRFEDHSQIRSCAVESTIGSQQGVAAPLAVDRVCRHGERDVPAATASALPNREANQASGRPSGPSSEMHFGIGELARRVALVVWCDDYGEHRKPLALHGACGGGGSHYNVGSPRDRLDRLTGRTVTCYKHAESVPISDNLGSSLGCRSFLGTLHLDMRRGRRALARLRARRWFPRSRTHRRLARRARPCSSRQALLNFNSTGDLSK